MLNGKYVTAHLFNTKLIDFANMLGSSNKDGCNQVRYTLKDVPDLSVLQGVRKCIFYKERSILVPIKTAKIVLLILTKSLVKIKAVFYLLAFFPVQCKRVEHYL